MTQRGSMASVAGTNILGRNSMYNVRRMSEEIDRGFDEGSWRWSYIKEQFKVNKLDELFENYLYKIHHGYFSLFLILQVVLFISHFFILLGVTLAMEGPSGLSEVKLDLILYGSIGILSLVGLVISERFLIGNPGLLKYASMLTFILLFITDLLVPIFHFLVYEEHRKYRPAYTTHLIIACYIFFNVSKNGFAILLGLFVSLVHIAVLICITYYPDMRNLPEKLGADVIYLTCINGLGLYFRLMTEVVKRKGFLDRRACVESTLKLKYEKAQEDQLMLSIIPEHIIKEVRSDILERIKKYEKNEEIPTEKPFENRYIQRHDNVTILYADIVNYTHMTTTLKSTQLVETLNELFGRFDDASEDLKVLRIKFLGDCYYCVAGLPPNPVTKHADACVELGLRMIRIIRHVREKFNLEIDMRIGIHSGSVLSGVIGKSKWQYDIWSNDVYIANRMETTGVAGKVHITEQTKVQLTKSYNIELSDKGSTDEQLRQYDVQTYLITPEVQSENPRSSYVEIIGQHNNNVEERLKMKINRLSSSTSNYEILAPNGRRSTVNNRRASQFRPNPSFSGTSTAHIRRNDMGDSKRRTGFMDSSINKFQEFLKNTDDSMRTAVKSMPLSKSDQWFNVRDIHPLFLVFRDFSTEKDFIREPDPLFKYYILSEIFILVCVIIIQALTEPRLVAWMGYAAMGVITLILLPLSWTHYIWHSCKYEGKPKNVVVSFLYACSQLITKSVTIRICIYLVLCGIFAATVFIAMDQCEDLENSEFDKDVGFIKSLTFLIFRSSQEPENDDCIIPWHMTQTCALAIIMSFLFLRVHVWLKLLFACVVTAVYSHYVWVFQGDFYMASETYNRYLDPRIAHILNIVYLTLTLHFIDRQMDYLNRLDHKWNKQLTSEQEEAREMHIINNILLNNILPMHVADYYLDVDREKGRLYLEEYTEATPVAVMFASIVDYSLELPERQFLIIMNGIISKFDELLISKYRNIEKIKVANWTYMAACGLDQGRRVSVYEDTNTRRTGEHVVISMLKFAVEMKKVLISENKSAFQQCKLRIGISHGEVTAGVVGSKKPLYDIWGDAVNMASRMDSTGLNDKIQVTENTADVIESCGYSRKFRGYIAVKGKSAKVPTYFVNIDDQNQLTRP